MTPSTAHPFSQAIDSIEEKVKNYNTERQALTTELQQIIDRAQRLLGELGGIAAPTRQARRGRPRGTTSKRGPGRPAVSGRQKKRTMSAEARAAISAAQKARWAKQKSGEKKK